MCLRWAISRCAARPQDRQPARRQLPRRAPACSPRRPALRPVRFAIEMASLGGVAVLNLEGVQTRYKNPRRSSTKSSTSARKRPRTSSSASTRNPSRRISSPAREGDQGRRRAVAVELDPATRGALRRHGPGSRRGHLCGAIDCLDRAATSPANTSRSISPPSQGEQIPIIIGNWVTYSVDLELMQNGVSGDPYRGWPRRGVHVARRARPRRTAGHGDRRLRRGPRCLFQENRALCADHHRRRHVQGRRCLQGAGLRRRTP